MSKEYKNIYQRIHAVMKKVDYIQKTKPKDGGMKYSSVSHDSVTASIRPELVTEDVIYFPQNLVYKQDGNRTEVTLDLVFLCVDKPEDKLIVPSFGFGVDNQDKGPGKAVSYAVKYALLKTFGLETGDDPENDSIDHKAKPKDAPVNTTPKAAAFNGFQSNDERMDWLHTAALAVQNFKSPEEISSWEKSNEPRIQGLGTNQKGWLEDLISKQRINTQHAPYKNGKGATHANA